MEHEQLMRNQGVFIRWCSPAISSDVPLTLIVVVNYIMLRWHW